MAIKLAPNSSGPIVAAFDKVAAERLSALELGIARAFDPDQCPADALPWLAYHYGIDVWSSAWTEAQKRAAVRDAIKNFRRRGTLGGLVFALGNFTTEVSVVEWWEEAGTPGTFRVAITGDATSTSAAAQAALAEIVARTAPYTRHYTIEVATDIDATFIAAPAMRVAKLLPVDAKIPALWPA